MEGLFRNKPSNKAAFADPSNRMSQRPTAVKSGQGLGFEDFGSSLNPPKPPVTYGKSSKDRSMPAARPPSRSQKVPPRISEDESDDELLLCSQSSMGGDATSPSRRVEKGKKKVAHVNEEETVRVGGRVLTAHPDYKPSSFNAIKGLRFTKNKKSTSAEGDSVAEIPPPSSSLDDSQDLLKSISDDIEIVDVPPSGASPSTRRMSPSATARRGTDSRDHLASKPPSDTSSILAKPRPRPRLVKKPAHCERDSSPESTPRPAAPKRGLPLSTKPPEPSSKVQGKRIEKLASSSRRELQEFPMSLQAKENVSDGARSGDAFSSKTKKVTTSRTPPLEQIPLPSPLRSETVPRSTTFPTLSPLSSFNDKGKERARPKSPVEDGDSTISRAKRGGPKPFPMSSEMLAGIDRRSRSPDSRSTKSTKRTSSDGSGAEQGRITKKRKDSRSGALDAIDYLHDPIEDDSIELGYARDPSTLCPYCDEELPSYPTPYFRRLLSAAREKSAVDPRPRNRGGLRAPLTVYISVCQRHRFESHQLPIATERGWPKTIDFTKVPNRVKKMKKDLEAIILDKDDSSDIGDLDSDDRRRGPRNKCVFWREMKKDMKKQGSRTVVGVKGQFASFERTQPGYYGEQGSVIIHQTLFDLFPPSTFDASLVAPLSPAEFIQRVLVPEAAVRLIVQDLCVDMEEAVITLRESAQYGVAMFPDTSEGKRKGGGDDEDEMSVADRIVMERARVRRKELEEEERIENEMLEEERAAQRAKARDVRRAKAVERAQQARQDKDKARHADRAETGDAVSEASEAGATHVAGRKTRRMVAADSESDVMSVDSRASRRSMRVAKKTTRVGGSKPVKVTHCSDSDSVEILESSKCKPGGIGTRSKTNAASHKQKQPFVSSVLLDSDGEKHESTPRPVRQQQRTTRVGSSEIPVDGLHALTLPSQVARNRPGASALATHDGWSWSLRAGVPEDSDSDLSNSSRRLLRPPIKKGNSNSWLLDCQWSGEDSSP